MNSFEWRGREPGLEQLTSLFESWCVRHAFKVLDAGAERYGSWEWVAFRSRDALTEFLVVVVLDSTRSARCEIELWRGLDDGVRFGRTRVERVASPDWFEVARVVNRMFDAATSNLDVRLEPAFLNNAAIRGTYWSRVVPPAAGGQPT